MASRNTLQRGITVILVVANLSLLVVYTSAWVSSRPQSNQKTVVRPLTLVKEPVEIKFEHRGKPLKENEEFESDADWVKDLKFKLKNKSGKTITYILLDVDFPETAVSSGRVAQQQISLGRDPEGHSTQQPIQLRPGESTEVSLEAGYDQIKHLISLSRPVESISKTVIRLHQVGFDDGTVFSSGSMYRRNDDPNATQKWVRIDD